MKLLAQDCVCVVAPYPFRIEPLEDFDPIGDFDVQHQNQKKLPARRCCGSESRAPAPGCTAPTPLAPGRVGGGAMTTPQHS